MKQCLNIDIIRGKPMRELGPAPKISIDHEILKDKERRKIDQLKVSILTFIN